MKKKSAFLALLLVLALMFVGCSNSTPQPSDSNSDASASEGADSTPISIKITTTQLPNQEMGKGIAIMADNLKKYLGDKVDVKTYDSAQLYSGAEELEALSRNEIQVAFAVAGPMETISEKLQIAKLPFLFPDVETAYRVFSEGETAKAIYEPVNEAGMKVMGVWSSGTALLANNKHPLKVPADFKGLKMRAPGKMDTLNLNALGANGVVTPAEETYSAVQQGVVDGMITPNSVFIPRKFYEVQKYVTNGGNISFQCGYMVVNSEFYDGLPADVKEGFDKAAADTEATMRANIEVLDKQIFKDIAGYGCEVYNLTDDEVAQWKEATASVYDDMAADLGQDLIDLAVKEADEFSK